MRTALFVGFALLLFVTTASAQSVVDTEAEIRAAVPFSKMALEVPGLTMQTYEEAVRTVARQAQGRPTAPSVRPSRPFGPAGPPAIVGEDGKYLGRLSSNPYDPESVSNPYGRYGSPYSPDSINNPYSQYGSPYSPYSATNPYATQAPKIVNPYGGRLSANPYAPDSTTNSYGRYGSPYSPDSITNPYGALGNPFGASSVTNPYAVAPLPPLPGLPTLPPLPGFAPLR